MHSEVIPPPPTRPYQAIPSTRVLRRLLCLLLSRDSRDERDGFQEDTEIFHHLYLHFPISDTSPKFSFPPFPPFAFASTSPAKKVCAKYGDESVYFDLKDIESTVGSWDLYGQDSPKRYPETQVRRRTKAGEIASIGAQSARSS